jgi:hypothetical protein
VIESAAALSYASTFEVLYFLYGQGCEACAAAEPELVAFMDRHPRLLVLRLDAMGTPAARLGIPIKATPTYVYRRGREGATASHIGLLTAKELDKWVKKAAATLGGAEEP